MKTVRVAAGIIRADDGSDRVLAVRRGHGAYRGRWEFPGGKVEAGESAEEACRRELDEELRVRVTDLRDFYTVEFDYEDFHLLMTCFLCRIESGEPTLTEQLELRWVARRDLAALPWLPADADLIAALSDGAGAAGQSDARDAELVRRRAATRKTMRANRRCDTKPELLVRRRLRAAGLTGYRLQWGRVPGRPDIAYPGRRIAIFVNGCFWHRCPVCQPSAPKRNAEFWRAKFRRNVERDALAIAELERLGWSTITIWECELEPDRIDATMERVIAQIGAARAHRADRPKGSTSTLRA